MGHRGSYVVVRERIAIASSDSFGAMALAELIEAGREKCVEYACSLEPDDEVLAEPWAEAGFVVDFDRREAMVFCAPSSDFIGWDDELSEQQRLERQRLDAFIAGSPESWLEHVQPRWEGFALSFVDSAESFVEHLEAHNIAIISPFKQRHLAGAVNATVPNLVTDEARRVQLGGAAVAPGAGDANDKPTGLLRAAIVVAMVIALPLGLSVRFLSYPLRKAIRPLERIDQAEQRKREKLIAKLRDISVALHEEPNDTKTLSERGHYMLGLRRYGQAELDFDQCTQQLDERDPKFGEALYNRGVARRALGLEELSTLDIEAAKDRGLKPPRTKSYIGVFLEGVLVLFLYSSGWTYG